MAFVVNIGPRDERDIDEIYDRINAASSDAALRWYLGLTKEILGLEEHPNRCPLIHGKSKLRHLLYGNKPHVYRVIYRVFEKQNRVEVLHIRHGARRKPG